MRGPPSIAETSVSFAASPARRTLWFDDLVTGSGPASAFCSELRTALMVVTVERALERATTAESNARAEQRDQRERRSGSQWAIVLVAFGYFGLRLIPGGALVLITVGLASLGAWVLPYFGQTSIAASVNFDAGFEDAWRITTTAMVALLLIGLVIDLILGPPLADHTLVAAWWGVGVGVALFLITMLTNSMTESSWYIAPACLAITYAIAAIVSGARRRLPADQHFTLRLLWLE